MSSGNNRFQFATSDTNITAGFLSLKTNSFENQEHNIIISYITLNSLNLYYSIIVPGRTDNEFRDNKRIC